MAKVHKSAASLLLAQTDRVRYMTGSARRVFAEGIAKPGVQDHYDLTSGSISAKTLAKLGHPFGRGQSPQKRGAGNMNLARRATSKKKLAKAGMRGRVPLLPINVQSGRLRRSFRVVGTGTSVSVNNSAPYARYILNPQGTKYMVGRGFGGQIANGAPTAGETVRRWRARNLGWTLRMKDLQKRA